ncbi:hypothetical protein ZTR_05321 [Talaromyces verruculosus]|nr:hypothetical protein ZTR_05321 [Talaromyces verruculosus]
MLRRLERPQACQGHSIFLRCRALHRPPVDQGPPTYRSQNTPKSIRIVPQQDLRPKAHPDRQLSLFVSKGPDFSRPRDVFAFTQIASGTVLSAIYPDSRTNIDPDFKEVDPVQNVSSKFPPTYIVHGQADTMVPIELSRELLKRLQDSGVKCGMTEVPNEEHTFAAMMKVGSEAWWLQRQGFDFLEEVIGKGPQ